MIDKEGAAEPDAGTDGKDKGGFAKVAERLNTLYPKRQRPISRQLVHKWHFNRHFNSFPESVGTTGTGEGRPVFDLKEVEDWYARYIDTRKPSGQRPRRQNTTTAHGEDTLAA